MHGSASLRALIRGLRNLPLGHLHQVRNHPQFLRPDHQPGGVQIAEGASCAAEGPEVDGGPFRRDCGVVADVSEADPGANDLAVR